MALLGGVSQGIDAFLKKKEEKKNEQEAIAFVRSQFPGIGDQEAKAGLKAAGGASAFVKFKQEQEQMQKAQQAASYAAMLSQGGGQPPTGMSGQVLNQFSPEVRAMGSDINARRRLEEAKIAQMEAETSALKIPKRTGFPDFQSANNELNRLIQIDAFPENVIGTIKFENGGYVIESSVKPSPNVPDPELESRIRLGEKGMEIDMASGDSARRLIPQTNRMISLLDGGLTTGKTTQLRTAFTGWAKAIGIDVDEEKLANAEEFETYATQQILGYFQETKGTISNKENELFGLMTPSVSRTPETNKRLLSVIRQRQKLDADIGDNARRGIAEGWSTQKIAQERQKLIKKYDESLPDPSKLNQSPKTTSPADQNLARVIGAFQPQGIPETTPPPQNINLDRANRILINNGLSPIITN
jgi:hypothetical protein